MFEAPPNQRLPGPSTLGAAVAAAACALRSAGIDSADLDARLLVAAAAGCSREALAMRPEIALSPDAHAALEGCIARRLAREPVSRILGRRDFYGRTFRVTPATLDPRPETETLIDAAKEIVAAEGWGARPLRLLDIGTGSGAILATLLAELPSATGLATDISQGALEVAEANAHDIGVGNRAAFRLARSLDGIGGPFDIVVSNPPYIPTADIASLDRDVAAYDPVEALDGGRDGLDIYREIAGRWSAVAPDGWVLVEVGAGQASDAAAILAEGARGRVGARRTWVDLGGHERCVAVRAQL